MSKNQKQIEAVAAKIAIELQKEKSGFIHKVMTSVRDDETISMMIRKAARDTVDETRMEFLKDIPRVAFRDVPLIQKGFEKFFQRADARKRMLEEKQLQKVSGQAQGKAQQPGHVLAKLVGMTVHGNVFINVAGKVVGAVDDKHTLREKNAQDKLPKGVTLGGAYASQGVAVPHPASAGFFQTFDAMATSLHRLQQMPEELANTLQAANDVFGLHLPTGKKALHSKETREANRDLAAGIAATNADKEKPLSSGANPFAKSFWASLDWYMMKALPKLSSGLTSNKAIGQHIDPDDRMGLMNMPEFSGTKEEIQQKKARWVKERNKIYRDYASTDVNPKTGRVYRIEAIERWRKLAKSDIGKEAGLDKRNPHKGMTKENDEGVLELKSFSTANIIKLVGTTLGKGLLGGAYTPIAKAIGAANSVVKTARTLNKTFQLSQRASKFMRGGAKAIAGGAKNAAVGIGGLGKGLLGLGKAALPALPYVALALATSWGSKKATEIGKDAGDWVANKTTSKEPPAKKLQSDNMVGQILQKEFGTEMPPERVSRAAELNRLAQSDPDKLKEIYKSVTGASALPDSSYIAPKAAPVAAISPMSVRGASVASTSPAGVDVAKEQPMIANMVTNAPMTQNQANTYTSIDMSYNHAKISGEDMFGGGSW